MDSAGRQWYWQDMQTRPTNAQCSRASLECHGAPRPGTELDIADATPVALPAQAGVNRGR
jgi:hypothetical protein